MKMNLKICFFVLLSNCIISEVTYAFLGNFTNYTDRLLKPSVPRTKSVNVKLTRMLLNKRTKKTRPVAHPHDTLTVHVLAALYQIVDVDQRSNLVGISAFFDMWWMDSFLTWDPAAFDNVTQTYLPALDVWTPDLYLYHSVQGSTALLVEQSAVSVYYNGMVRIFIPFTAKALCTINVKYFPFDNQSCYFVFGSWSYQERDVNYLVVSPVVDLNDFYDNQEWRLTQSFIHNSRSVYENGFVNESYSTVTIEVSISRESFYYIFNLVIPSTLVTLVTIMGFHVPSDSTERRESKFRLGIMALLSMGVLLLNVVDDMPKFSMFSIPGKRGSFSDVPLLGIYYLSLIVIVSLGTYTSSLFVKLETYALHHPYDIPCWLKWILFNYHPPFLDRYKTKEKSNGVIPVTTVSEPLELAPNHLQDNQVDQLCYTGLIPHVFNNNKKISSPGEIHNFNKTFHRLNEICSDILREISFIRISLDKKTDDKVITRVTPLTKEWSCVIKRCEAVSLMLYFFVIGTALILFYARDWY